MWLVLNVSMGACGVSNVLVAFGPSKCSRMSRVGPYRYMCYFDITSKEIRYIDTKLSSKDDIIG